VILVVSATNVLLIRQIHQAVPPVHIALLMEAVVEEINFEKINYAISMLLKIQQI